MILKKVDPLPLIWTLPKSSFKDSYISLRLWGNFESEEIIKYFEEKFNRKVDREKGFRLIDRVFFSFDEEFEWPSLNGKFLGTSGKCKGCREQIAILANGDVVPCCLDSDGIMVLGNAFEKSFKEILNSERCLNIKKGFENNIAYEELCQKCSYKLKFK